MKRNYYFFLMVLFILSACQPSPGGQGQAATATPTITSTVRPTATPPPANTPTPEISYKINPTLPDVNLEEFIRNFDRYSSEFSIITFEDIISGKIREKEIKYLENNEIFGDEIFQNSLFLNGATNNHKMGKTPVGSIDQLFVDIFASGNDVDTRPFQIISFYVIDDDNFFSNNGINPSKNEAKYAVNITENQNPIWLVSYAYHNPNGRISIIHSVVDIFMHYSFTTVPQKSDLRPGFVYDYVKINMTEDKIRTYNDYLTFTIYQKYPQLKPDIKSINNWVSSKEMPLELEKCLFSIYHNRNLTW